MQTVLNFMKVRTLNSNHNKLHHIVNIQQLDESELELDGVPRTSVPRILKALENDEVTNANWALRNNAIEYTFEYMACKFMMQLRDESHGTKVIRQMHKLTLVEWCV